MINLKLVLDTIVALRDFVASTPELTEFVPAAEALVKQAQTLASGNMNVPPLAPMSSPKIDGRHVAQRLVTLMSALPLLDGDEDDRLRLAVARLYGNITVGITQAIYRSHPDVVRRTRTPTPGA